MICGLGIPRVEKAFLAEEDEDDLAGHVVGRQQCGHESDDPQGLTGFVGAEEDLVFRPEAGERWHPGDRQPPHQECAGRNRHPFPDVAHALHVLRVIMAVHSMNYRSGTEKHEGLEERVGHHVEYGGDVRSHPDGQEHVAELTDR